MPENRPSRRRFLGAAAAGSAAWLLSRRAPAQGDPAKRPNILLAITDNQSWLHTGAMGDRLAETPAFDRIAAEGVLFNQAFCPSPSCTPSRSALLTGQDFWRLEEGSVLHGGLPAKFPCFTDLLREAGYHLGYTGKGWGPGRWDLYGRDANPCGKDYNSIYLEKVPRDIFRADYAANFEAFLAERGEGQPFCFWFGAKEPHRPFARTTGNLDSETLDAAELPSFLPAVEPIQRDMMNYHREIAWQDRHLGKMLAVLEARGELDNTVIVAASDNGMQFPRGIANLYDHGTRVPLAMRWGNEIAGGQRRDGLVNLTDLAPTFLEAAGIAPPEAMTGRSILPWVRGEGRADGGRAWVAAGMERHSLCRHGELPYPMRMLRTSDYLYIRNFEPGRWPAGDPDYPAPAQGFHGDVDDGPTKQWFLKHPDTPEFALCFGRRPGEELYDVREDPDQVRNLAALDSHQETLAALRQKLEDHLRESGDPRIRGEAPWDSYPSYYLKLLNYKDMFTNQAVLPSLTGKR